ncbi:MAG: hypothetical protein H6658_02610 [Ardenticatenaceae bacterium]|nr:hypothetical protein [Ardenticatenaceae bacterium]
MQNPVVVMRVLRMPPMGKLVVEVNKNRYEKWDDISDENVKRLLLAAFGELIVFANGYENLVEAGFAPPIVSEPAPERPLADRQAAFLSSLESEKSAAQNAKTVPPTFATLAPRKPGSKPATPAAPTTIVEQIDAIVQKHLVANPELAQHEIHLRQDGSGGLRIVVDGTAYSSPKEIENPDIQAVIKRALLEWERS